MNAASPPAESPSRGEPDGYRFPRDQRIHSGQEIRRIMRRGKRERTTHLDVFSAASPSSFPRFGLVVPKHRRRIVDRNRLKRRLREIARLEILPGLRRAGCDLDVLVRARPHAYDAGYERLRDELTRWLEHRT
ncbi:MAG: ribonuclease P protein component [Gemmatimonadota bacterium]